MVWPIAIVPDVIAVTVNKLLEITVVAVKLTVEALGVPLKLYVPVWPVPVPNDDITRPVLVFVPPKLFIFSVVFNVIWPDIIDVTVNTVALYVPRNEQATALFVDITLEPLELKMIV